MFLDRWVYEGLEGGVFVDVGAHDGIALSNSFFFERARGWQGACIEPSPAVFERLAAGRRCVAPNCCVSSRPGTVVFRNISGYSEMFSGVIENYHAEHGKRIERELKEFGGSSKTIAVEARAMGDIAAQRGILEITYLSIDTEGGELQILPSMNFKRPFVYALTIGCNFEEMKTEMVSLMNANGFDFARQLTHDLFLLNRSSPFIPCTRSCGRAAERGPRGDRNSVAKSIGCFAAPNLF